MARFIQLISPILQLPAPGRLSLSRTTAQLFSNLLAWLLVFFSFYCCVVSDSILLLGAAILQIAFSFLIVLESLLGKINTAPLKSRRLEMTAYCMGGVMLLLLCIYQFSEAFVRLQHPNPYRSIDVTVAVVSSIAGNLVLVRLLWRSGLIRNRIRAFCQPLLGILFLNLLSLFSSLIIQLTGYNQLDALMAMFSSAVLFLISAGIMIDAYCHLIDLEKTD